MYLMDLLLSYMTYCVHSIKYRQLILKVELTEFSLINFSFACSRTLTAVHDAILEDLSFPAEIVGKRIRIKLDGSRLIKVHLDKNQQTNIEHKVSIRNIQVYFKKDGSCPIDLFLLKILAYHNSFDLHSTKCSVQKKLMTSQTT